MPRDHGSDETAADASATARAIISAYEAAFSRLGGYDVASQIKVPDPDGYVKLCVTATKGHIEIIISGETARIRPGGPSDRLSALSDVHISMSRPDAPSPLLLDDLGRLDPDGIYHLAQDTFAETITFYEVAAR